MNKKYLSLTMILLLCSCNNDIKGSWEVIVANTDNIHSTSMNSVSPFNTIMQLNYFINDDNDNQRNEIIENVSNIYNEEVSRLHCYFDRHYDYLDEENNLITNLKTINNSFGKNTPIKCSDELYSLLKFSVECYELTDGYFNIFTGTITDYWDSIFNEIYNYGDLYTLDPYYDASQRDKLEGLVDSIPSNIDEFNAQLTFDDFNKTVCFNSCDFNNGKKILISLGGVAKGFATDIIKDKLLENGYTDGYLISGGSSLSTVSNPIFTKKQGGQSVSVINPGKSSLTSKESAFSIKFSEKFNFSTSGNYTANKSYSFETDDGNSIYRHHIINPFTGYPESYHSSISISTSSFSNGHVDALSTAFMCLDVKGGIELKNRLLEKYQNYDLELYYLQQSGYGDTATYKVITTSSNDSLTVSKGVELVYES